MSENIPLTFMDRTGDNEAEMQICFKSGQVAYLRGQPKDFLEWAMGIIEKIEKLFGTQDDWADDFIAELKKRHAHEHPF